MEIGAFQLPDGVLEGVARLRLPAVILAITDI
jgi:hypothetical protein